MKVADLLISGLSITEDNYHYVGQFILGTEEKSINVNLNELDSEESILLIKKTFDLEESNNEIRNSLMDRIVVKSGLSSKNVQGENYNKGKGATTTNTDKDKHGFINRA